jgi:hypothetical protein
MITKLQKHVKTMRKIIILPIMLLIGNIAFGQTSTERILEYVNCVYAKTFTYRLEAECQENETIVRRWLLKDFGTPAENATLHTFYFATTNDKFELTKGKSLWPEFEKKMIQELDSIEHLDAAHQAILTGLSQTDSLHNAVNRLPGLQKKRDTFWKARKAKKDIFTEYETTYKTAKATYDEGDMLPSEWDAIEVKYLMLKEELDFLKTELQNMNETITQYQTDIARLKKETGLLQYKSYREF